MKTSLRKRILISGLEKFQTNFSRFFSDEITINNNKKRKKGRLEMKNCWTPLKLLVKKSLFILLKIYFVKRKVIFVLQFIESSSHKIHLKLSNEEQQHLYHDPSQHHFFKLNNGNTRTMTHWYGASIVDFKQVNAGWE